MMKNRRDDRLNIDEVLKDVKTIAITGHIRPDGDCTGSVLGLCNYIYDNMPGKEVDIYLESIPEEFHFLRFCEKVTQQVDVSKVYDLFIVLDCAAFDRFEAFRPLFDNAKSTLCIDHHKSGEPIADTNMIVPEYSSCSELVFDTMSPDKISKYTAECLYVGIIHDTGVLKYQATTPDTMMAAGVLMSKGIDYTSIIDNTFYSRTYRQSQALGKALLESVLFFDGRCIFSIFSKKDMDFYGVDGGDLGGIVEQLRLTDGVEVAIFIYENEINDYKVSLRSKKYVDVGAIAQFFGGGGHTRASGFSMNANDPRDIINNIGAQLVLQMK